MDVLLVLDDLVFVLWFVLIVVVGLGVDGVVVLIGL